MTQWTYFAALLMGFEMSEVETLMWCATSIREAKSGDYLKSFQLTDYSGEEDLR